jgi:(+)-trans-carveol dehydrogenase
VSGRPLPLAGRVAVVTGAARGQGRSHVGRLAADGASIVAIDACADIPSAPYAGATPADLEQTLAMIDAAGAHGASAVADVRDLDALTRAIDEGLDALVARGAIEQRRLDVVVANAGIAGGAPVTIMDAASWREMIDIDLTGVWNTIKASVPSMIEAGHGGSIVIISSANGGLKAPPNLAHYASAKHGLVGMMRSLANELGAERIRVNTVHPTAVDTSMICLPIDGGLSAR